MSEQRRQLKPDSSEPKSRWELVLDELAQWARTHEKRLGSCGLCACRLGDGRCHRLPATVVSGWPSLWPKVEPDDLGCYEFRAKGAGL